MKVNFGTKGQLQIINILSGGTFTTRAPMASVWECISKLTATTTRRSFGREVRSIATR